MAKFHINGRGEAGKCTATQGGCPFGGENEHYPTPESARDAYEGDAEKKKGLFSRFTSKKEPNPVAKKDRRSTDGALDMRRFDGLLAIAKKEKWDVMEDGTILRASGSKQNTFEALSQLQRNDREGGTAFEQADRLRDAYTQLREAGEVESPSYGPKVLSRDLFIRMVAPATHAAVSTIEADLEKQDWDTRVDPSQPDENQKTFSKILKLDMDSAQGRADALKITQEAGWDLDSDDEDALAKAVKKGQVVATTYGSRFKYEQEYLF